MDLAEKRLFDLVNEGHPSAIIFTLKTLGKHRGYIERQEHEISGPAGGAIRISERLTSAKSGPHTAWHVRQVASASMR